MTRAGPRPTGSKRTFLGLKNSRARFPWEEVAWEAIPFLGNPIILPECWEHVLSEHLGERPYAEPCSGWQV